MSPWRQFCSPQSPPHTPILVNANHSCLSSEHMASAESFVIQDDLRVRCIGNVLSWVMSA